ncbi:MAG TPA: lipoyl(octanoyl) transferase LipB [Roseateles sp.]|nr:lipoyl(octanoyl) transferase LipB [Roseateles sp.]HWT54620.1 lipoyl(octanoyl) transferase LipB [Rhodocyclaceae bacterium]
MHFKELGRVDYATTLQAMRDFTAQRNTGTEDEVWLLEHPPVFTLGLAGKREHLIANTDIPVVNIDRGGQITYHGPGQLVAYLLLDLNRRPYKVRQLVERMEDALIGLLADYGVKGERLAGAPGVYVGGAKIAALGLRVQKGCTYHGLALNVDMDLAPWQAINPCGYPGMQVAQLRDFVPAVKIADVIPKLREHLRTSLS